MTVALTAAANFTAPPRAAIRTAEAAIAGNGEALRPSAMIRLPQKATAPGGSVIYANMVYDPSWENITDYNKIPIGIYSFEASSKPIPTAIDTSSEMEGIGGAILDGKYYFITATYNANGNIDGGMMYIYNTTTWIRENRKMFGSDNPGALAFQMATDHARGIIYTVSYNDNMNGYVFGKFDPSTMRRTTIAECPYMHALAVDTDGTVYGINLDSELVKIDTDTGNQTVIGPTGVNIEYLKQSGTIDPQTGTFYWAPYNSSTTSALYQVDKTTGHATKIGDFPGRQEFVAMAIAPEKVDSDAPARPGAISADFRNGSLSGNLTVTAPSLTFGGQPLTGALTAFIYYDGEELTSTQAEAGKTFTTQIQVPSDGMHSITARFKNEKGTGPSNGLNMYFGTDVPGSVVEPTLTNRDGTAELVWDAPETGLHGGYINPANFRYSVSKIIAGKETQVASGLNATEFSETIQTDNMVTVRYRVTAYHNDRPGADAISTKALFGTGFSAPYTWYLDDPDEFELFTPVDANKDGFSWESGTWRYTQNKTIYAQNMWNDDDKTDADDWFISPKVKLRPGRVYYFTFSAGNTMMTKKETFEVKMGENANVESMTKTIQEPVTIESSDVWYRNRTPLQVDKEGLYNIGIHCISKAPDYYRLYVDTIGISEGPAFLAPGKPTGTKITPAELGKLKATITAKLPSTTVNGTSLTSITKLEVRRGFDSNITTIATITEGLTPGADFSFTDENPENGYNTYTLVPYNNDGIGEEATVKGFVGNDTPGETPNVRMEITADNIQLSWDAIPNVGIEGGYIDPADVVYDVFDCVKMEYVAKGLNALTTSIGNPSEGTPSRRFWGVVAHNKTGRGKLSFSPYYIHGTAYPAPFIEKFTNGKTDNRYWFSWDSNPMATSAWRLGTDQTGNGMMMFYGQPGGYNMILPAPIDVSKANHPVLSFEYMKQKGTDNDRMEVYVTSSHFSNFEKVLDVPASETMKRVMVDLSKYKNSPRLTIALKGYAATATAGQYIDNIQVFDILDNNLTLVNVDAPGAVRYNSTAKIKANVGNFGANRVDSYMVCLYRDGKTLVDSKDGSALATGESNEVTLEYKASINDPDNVSLHVEVVFENDENPDDDACEPFKINVKKPVLPAVDDLTLNASGKGMIFSWTRPDYADGYPAMEVTDDVEDCIDFEIEDLGMWTPVDKDGAMTYSIQNVPAYPHQFGPAAFQVFNPKTLGVGAGTNISAKSGDKYFIAFAPQGVKADDWIFSPELSGDSQTVSFYARGLNDRVMEDFEVWCSETDPDPAKATKVKAYKTTGGWNEFKADLPSGAKYFAIRYVSPDGNALMLDDLTFVSAPRECELPLKGYNLYSDGNRVNENIITDTRYECEKLNGESFIVRAQYDGMESKDSNAVSASGVDGITIDSDEDGLMYDLNGIRIQDSRPGNIYVKKGKKFIEKTR